MTLRVFSYGGGVQSTAALVLAAQGKIDFPIFLFSNVGDDSELPATLVYVRDVAMPYASAHNIDLHELRHTRRDGREDTLYSFITRPEIVGAMIPIYLGRSGAPGVRGCTTHYKVRRVDRWLRKHGATKDDPAIVGLGISLDELHRMRNDSDNLVQHRMYPLIDLRLTRQDCINIIERASLPVPPKSACYFCPYHNATAWQKLKATTPELFDKAVELEKLLSDRSDKMGRGKVFLTRKLIPLNQVIGDQPSLFDEPEDACESGYCMT